MSRSVESTSGSFWSCVTVTLDEDGDSTYSNLIVRYKGEAILVLSDHSEIVSYFMCNVLLNIEIMKEELL